MKVIKKFKSRSIAGLCEADGVRFTQRGRRFCKSLPRLGWSFLGQRSNKRRIHNVGCTMSSSELSFTRETSGGAEATMLPGSCWQGK